MHIHFEILCLCFPLLYHFQVLQKHQNLYCKKKASITVIYLQYEYFFSNFENISQCIHFIKWCILILPTLIFCNNFFETIVLVGDIQIKYHANSQRSIFSSPFTQKLLTISVNLTIKFINENKLHYFYTSVSSECYKTKLILTFIGRYKNAK